MGFFTLGGFSSYLLLLFTATLLLSSIFIELQRDIFSPVEVLLIVTLFLSVHFRPPSQVSSSNFRSAKSSGEYWPLEAGEMEEGDDEVEESTVEESARS